MSKRTRENAIRLHSDSVEQTMQIARDLAVNLRPGDLVALEGPLGSGKTCFVRGLAAGLGLNPSAVSSPTFVICQEYQRDSGGGGMNLSKARRHGGTKARSDQIGGNEDPAPLDEPPTLVHIDAYRLSGPGELDTIGWNEMLEARDAIIAVEWPSRIAAALPPAEDRVDVTFAHAGEHSREITISGRATSAESPAVAASKAAKCRTCGKPISTSLGTFPFCSDRCRLADLGKWFNEGYRTSRAAEADEELNE